MHQNEKGLIATSRWTMQLSGFYLGSLISDFIFSLSKVSLSHFAFKPRRENATQANNVCQVSCLKKNYVKDRFRLWWRISDLLNNPNVTAPLFKYYRIYPPLLIEIKDGDCSLGGWLLYIVVFLNDQRSTCIVNMETRTIGGFWLIRRNDIMATYFELPSYQDLGSMSLSPESFNMVYQWKL